MLKPDPGEVLMGGSMEGSFEVTDQLRISGLHALPPFYVRGSGNAAEKPGVRPPYYCRIRIRSMRLSGLLIFAPGRHLYHTASGKIPATVFPAQKDHPAKSPPGSGHRGIRKKQRPF